MSFFYGDPDELDKQAARVAAAAEEVRSRARVLQARADAVAWESTAADGFRRMVSKDAAAMVGVSQALDEAARELRRHAAVVRERLAMIRSIEEAVRGWFGIQLRHLATVAAEAADALTDPLEALTGVARDPPWFDWPWTPDNVPEPGDQRWLEVGEFFRAKGVPL